LTSCVTDVSTVNLAGEDELTRFDRIDSTCVSVCSAAD